MPPSLNSIRLAALKLASCNWSPSYKLDLTHIAADAQSAIDGCTASLESVMEFIEGDHELYCAAEALDDEPVVRPAEWTLAARAA